jgi:LysM repeat protein
MSNEHSGDCPGESYTVKPGDTLYKIAQRYNTTVEQLIKANSQIENPAQISVGQVICIPKEDTAAADCAVILTLSREAEVSLSALAGGVVLVRQLEEGDYALTFAAVGLPVPESIGEFDTYLGFVNIAGQEYSAILRPTAPSAQEATWAGTRIIPETPFTDDSAVTIVPFNLETGTRTNPILGGNLTDCK